MPTPVTSFRYIQSTSAFAIWANDWLYQMDALKSQNRAVPSEYGTEYERVLSWFRRSKVQPYVSPDEEAMTNGQPDPQKVFRHRFFVLIDRQCASACETTLQALEGLPGRVLVGENTYGAVAYGQVGMVILPHSHVAVQLAMRATIYRDERNPEKVGYAPQIEVPPGQDALTAVLSRLRGGAEDGAEAGAEAGPE